MSLISMNGYQMTRLLRKHPQPDVHKLMPDMFVNLTSNRSTRRLFTQRTRVDESELVAFSAHCLFKIDRSV